MELADFLVILSRLIIGGIGTFFAILLWSKTRDIAWVLVIIGTLIGYTEIVFTTFESFGLIGEELLSLGDLPVFKILLVNLPIVFYAAAFMVVISRKRLP